MNRIKGIIYDIIGLFACIGFRQKSDQKKLLIIRIDEIGDYMLWRNFLNEITSAPTYRPYEIHFAGNKSWKSLFELLDTDSVHKSFWIDKTLFKKDLKYRYRFLKMIYRQGYDTVINPTFSRDKRNDDCIVKAAFAKHRIGMVANTESVQPYEKGYDQGLYTHLFDYPEKPVFEFFRNKLFTAFVTGIASAVEDTGIPKSLLTVFEGLPQKFVVIFPGSRSASRIWPTNHFVAVASYLFRTQGFTMVVCGAVGDKTYTDAFCAVYPYPVIDLTGKTSLPQMLSILAQAALLLSVDTGSVHLAAAVGCPVIGVFNGSQYQRFAPYPSSLAPHFYTCYPDHIEKELADVSIVREKYEFVIAEPYANVLPEKVIKVIDDFLKK
ncbi:MAG: glycosyltransferase family 9 protein [Chitinophagaceae bacterium]|nr:glycosyltransferase family 9 protein [Chitinophagaceae bacterium]